MGPKTDDASAPAQTPAPRSIGDRLRAGRERAGLSVAAAAEKLHLDPKVIEALEAGRFADLGASVYVRGHLRRYGDFVGEQGRELVDTYAAREASPVPPDLTQVPHPERRADPRRLVTPLVSLGGALVLLLAIWWVLAGSNGGSAKPQAAQAVPAPAAVVSDAPVAANTPPALVTPAAGTPVVAPATPAATNTEPEAPPPPARPLRLTLQLTNDSWVEVYDSRGEKLFYDVASAGSVQSVEGRPPLRVVLGNPAGVAVEVDGRSREIPATAIDDEGARFVVNRSGSLSRARK